MAKKHGSVWKGIRDAYSVHEAQETLMAISRASRDTFWEIGNVALMILAVAFIAGLFYVFG